MNTRKTDSIVLTLLLITVFGFQCECCAEASKENASIEDVKMEASDLLNALAGYTADQRDEALEQIRSSLEELDYRIDGLEERIDNDWDKMDAAARQKARDSLKTLRKQRIRVAEWYGGLKSSSVDAWRHLRNGFSDAYKVFFDDWEKAEQEFDSSN
jgi:hypothetical protein